MHNKDGIIYCIGDSHVSFFLGVETIQPLWPEPSLDYLPFFKTYRLGAVLAYNLCKTGTRMLGREKLLSILQSEIPTGSNVLLCFGEIDCRVHLIKQAGLQKRSIVSVVEECVDRYFSVVKEIVEMGYEVLIWNVIPSSMEDHIINPDYPFYGNCLERNNSTKKFNIYLKGLCNANAIKFISIFDKLIDDQGLTKMKFYMDETHLSQRAMPLAIKSIKDEVCDIDFSLPVMYKIKLILSYVLRPFIKFRL